MPKYIIFYLLQKPSAVEVKKWTTLSWMSPTIPPAHRPKSGWGKGEVSLVALGVPDHDGGRPEEVNSCVLNSYMVYL